MSIKIALMLFSMVLGPTMAMSGLWNPLKEEHQRLEYSSGYDLRQSNLISYQCSSSGAKGCFDCGNFPFCASPGTSAYNITCSATQVCQNVNGIGSCVAYNSATDCVCTTSAYVPDPYDLTGNKYLTCLLGKPPIKSQCPTGQRFDFVNEVCSSTPTGASCPQGGTFLLSCRQAYFCAYVGATPQLYLPCTTEQVYDLSQGKCVPIGSLTLPTFTCVGALDGAVADNLECNAFRVCMSGVEQGAKNCCPAGQVFSPQLMRCTTDPNIVACPQKNPCDTNTYTYSCSGTIGIVTTTTTTIIPPSGTNCTKPSCTVNGPYPYSSDCKQYYFCSGGKATVQPCTAQLFFDSTKRYCTKLSDWTGCKCV